MKRVVLILSTALLFISCSGKNSYKPDRTKRVHKRLPFLFNSTTIEKIGHNRVYLSNGKVFDRDGVEIEEVEEYGVIYSKHENLIAYITEENVLKLLEDEKEIFSANFDKVSTIDVRIPAPLFDGRNILYFTLDGKIAIYSKKFNKISRVVPVSFASNYSNVIDYRLFGKSLTLITHREILQIDETFDKKISLPIRGAIFKENYFFLITKDGEIRKYDYKLQLLNSKKFPLAYFVAFREVDERIYLLESEGYLIDLDINFQDYKVYYEPIDLDRENCFFTPQKLICDNKTVRLPL